MTIYHKHHVVPRHMGGTDDPSNIVELTIEEHAEAHRILFEQYGRWQDKLAWQGLLGLISKEDILRETYRCNLGRKLGKQSPEHISKRPISITGPGHPKYGTPAWNKGKKMRWITDGQNTRQISREDIIPDGWRVGRATSK